MYNYNMDQINTQYCCEITFQPSMIVIQCYLILSAAHHRQHRNMVHAHTRQRSPYKQHDIRGPALKSVPIKYSHLLNRILHSITVFD